MTDKPRLGPVQNTGWFDRIARFAIGLGIIIVILLELEKTGNLGEYAYLPIISIYPLLTAILGWDPIYAYADFGTCDVSSKRNKCGTFPFEMGSALGKQPACDDDHECSLTTRKRRHRTVQ